MTYRKPRRPKKPRPDQSAERLVMKACALATENGFMVLSAHTINGYSRIVIISQRSKVNTPCVATYKNLTVEWRTQ